MIVKDVILWVIVIFMFLRLVIKKFRGNYNVEYLFISLFVVTAPFNFEWEILRLIKGAAVSSRYLDFLSLSISKGLPGFGSFGSDITVTISLVFILIFLVTGNVKVNQELFKFQKLKWYYIAIAFCIISFFNPYNLVRQSALPVISYLTQYTLCFIFIASNFEKGIILKGVYDGLIILTITNLLLTLCFPILNMEKVVLTLNGSTTLMDAVRREGYPAAVGVFVHPLPLAIFTLIPLAFFLSCWLTRYGRRPINALLVCASLLTCFFTFSRTTYLSLFIAIMAFFLVYYYFNNSTRKAPKNRMLAGISTSFAVLIGLYYYLAAFHGLGLFKDADFMLQFRETHWRIAYEIWKNSILLGIGINANVYYMQHVDMAFTGLVGHSSVNYAIHSFHLTILAECGLLGFCTWLCFILFRIKDLISGFNNNMDKTTQIFKMTFFMAFIGFLIYGFFNPLPYSMLAIFLFFGFIANLDRGEVNKVTPSRLIGGDL